jgi:Lrp/AsnC family leucine-responsive transcriptional regulator
LPIKLDAIDVRILEALQEDGRMTIAELAERVGLSTSPAHRRQKLLEESCVIKRYAAVIDAALIGLPMRAYTFISFSEHTEAFLSAVEQTLARCPQVVECHLLAGQDDFMIHTLTRDLEELEAFLKTKIRPIEGIRSIRTSFSLRSVGSGSRVR